MAHCAEIDNQGIVKRVIVVEENYGDLTCEQWCEKTYGGTWLKTSYNTRAGNHEQGGVPLRGNYAGVGYSYDGKLDAFLPPKPFKSWKVDKKTCTWKAPKVMPSDGKKYRWNEEALEWVKI